MRQGRRLTPEDRARIMVLLRTTEIPMGDIAQRFNLTRGAVNAINRRYQIRPPSFTERRNKLL
jgi:hypothetical protein